MIVGIFDFETTGLDVATCDILEHAVILAELDPRGEERPKVHAIDTALWNKPAKITEEITKLTGIDQQMVTRHGKPGSSALQEALTLLGRADFLVGHNLLQYDRELLAREWLSLDGFAKVHSVFNKPCIDTMLDLPRLGKSGDLTYMAADYGIASPNAHRAIFDCITLLSLLGRMNAAAIAQAVEISTSELVEVISDVTFHEKDKAKNRGYFFEPLSKSWRKVMRSAKFRAEQEEMAKVGVRILPYPVVFKFADRAKTSA